MEVETMASATGDPRDGGISPDGPTVGDPATPAEPTSAPEGADVGTAPRKRKPRDGKGRKRHAAAERNRRRKQAAKEQADESTDDAPGAEAQGAEPAPESAPQAVDAGEFEALSAALWEQAAEALKGTRYAIKPSGLATLTSATAPVLAKYLPKMATTPEALLAVAVLSVFGPPAIKHARDHFKATNAARGA